MNTIDIIKYKLFVMIVLLLSFTIQAQETSSKKTLWNVQVGIMGIWLNNEIQLSEKFVLRNEAGVEMINWSISHNFLVYGDTKAVIPFVLTTEPKFYFARQGAKEAWFLSLKTSYHPPFLLFSNNKYSDISVVPTIIARTKLGKHFTVEMGGGIGYQYIFNHRDLDPFESGSDWAFNAVLRIGYKF